jgi:hypothetical protein
MVSRSSAIRISSVVSKRNAEAPIRDARDPKSDVLGVFAAGDPSLEPLDLDQVREVVSHVGREVSKETISPSL